MPLQFKIFHFNFPHSFNWCMQTKEYRILLYTSNSLCCCYSYYVSSIFIFCGSVKLLFHIHYVPLVLIWTYKEKRVEKSKNVLTEWIPLGKKREESLNWEERNMWTRRLRKNEGNVRKKTMDREEWWKIVQGAKSYQKLNRRKKGKWTDSSGKNSCNFYKGI